MPASETGVTCVNHYADPRMWGDLYQELVYGAIGSGVAAGDFDQDGRPDLFIANKSDPPHLYRNLGGFRFEDVTEKALVWPAGNAWVQGVTWTDVDNDGWLDLYVCRFNAANLLFINQRNGTFKEEAVARGLGLVDASGAAAFGDYDRDGWLDVYIQTNLLSAATQPDGQPDHLFRNLGNGRFEEVTEAAGIRGRSFGHAAVWWDYNEDGWPDVYVSNDYAAPDHLYENQRNGTFVDVLARVAPRMPYYSMGSDLADVDNNGHLDLLATDMAASTPEKDQRGMAGSRARTQLAEKNPRLAPQLMRNALYLNEGGGLLREGAALAGIAATDWTWSPRWEDYDNDGRMDLIVTNGMIREYHNADLLQRIMGLEAQGASRQVMRESPLLADSDLAFRNLGGLRFEAVGEKWGIAENGVAFGSATADLDGDGDLDLVRIRYMDTPEILRNDGASGQALQVSLEGIRSNRFGVGAVVRAKLAGEVLTRTVTLARGYLSCSEPAVHFGLGSANRVDDLEITWPSGSVQSLGAVEAGLRLTVREPEAGESKRKEERTPLFAGAVLEGTENDSPTLPDSASQPFLPWTFQQRGPALAIAPLQASEGEWLAIGGTRGTPARVLHNGKVVQTFPLDPDMDDGPLAWLDADGDGDLDLLVTKLGAHKPAGSALYRPRLWLNPGSGPLVEGPTLALSASVGALAVADINHDGFVDILFGARNLPGRYPLPAKSALWLGGPGGFADATDALFPALRELGLTTGLLWIDANLDGRLDLVATTEAGGVRLFLQRTEGGWEEAGEPSGFASAGRGFWSSLAVADFNGDGRPDFILGNAGLNTPYRGTPDAPDVFLFGDFKEGGSPLLVEGFTDEGRLLPRRTRAELVTRIPAVGRRAPSNDAFARADLATLLTPEKVAAARRWDITELRSGVLLSAEPGRWAFHALPTAAQLAPLQGMAVGDWNGDGSADLALVQNFFGSAPYLGRFTGGLGSILLGDGQGGFREMPPAQSAFVIRGDGKSLVMSTSEGRPSLVASRHGDSALRLECKGDALLVVRVVGSLQETAGARIIYRQNGTAQPATQWIVSHSGYLGQSAPLCVFAPPGTDAEIEIHWPNGTKTEAKVAANATFLNLDAPGAATK